MPFNFVVSNKIQPIWLELLARLEGFSYLCILFFYSIFLAQGRLSVDKITSPNQNILIIRYIFQKNVLPLQHGKENWGTCIILCLCIDVSKSKTYTTLTYKDDDGLLAKIPFYLVDVFIKTSDFFAKCT